MCDPSGQLRSCHSPSSHRAFSPPEMVPDLMPCSWLMVSLVLSQLNRWRVETRGESPDAGGEHTFELPRKQLVKTGALCQASARAGAGQA